MKHSNWYRIITWFEDGTAGDSILNGGYEMKKMIWKRTVCTTLLISMCLSIGVRAGNNDPDTSANVSHPMSAMVTEDSDSEENSAENVQITETEVNKPADDNRQQRSVNGDESDEDRNEGASDKSLLTASIAKAFLQQLYDDWSDYSKIRTKFALIGEDDSGDCRLSVRKEKENGEYEYDIFSCKEKNGEVSCEKVNLSELTVAEQKAVENYDGYMSFLAVSGYLKGFISGSMSDIDVSDDEALWAALFLGYSKYLLNSPYSDDFNMYNPDGYDRGSILYDSEGNPAMLIGKSDPYPSGLLITLEDDHIVENDITEDDSDSIIREQYGDQWKEEFEKFTYPIDELREELKTKLHRNLEKKAVTYENSCYKLLCLLLAGEQDIMGYRGTMSI